MNQENKAYVSSISRDIEILLSKFKDLNFVNEYINREHQLREEEREEIIHVLRKYKWLVPIHSMPMRLLSEIVKTAKLKGNHRAEINNMFVEHFSYHNYKTLSELVETWSKNPLFQRRIKILRDCIAILKTSSRDSNPSNVILPTLISQIDGVLTDFANRLGIENADKRRDKFKGEFRRKTTDNRFSEAFELGNDILLNILFQTSTHGKPLDLPFYFQRHKIMHGEFTKYGRLDNTLRAFLLLDFLHLASTEIKK